MEDWIRKKFKVNHFKDSKQEILSRIIIMVEHYIMQKMSPDEFKKLEFSTQDSGKTIITGQTIIESAKHSKKELYHKRNKLKPKIIGLVILISLFLVLLFRYIFYRI